MPRYDSEEEWHDDYQDDADDADDDSSADEPTIPCPHCGHEIHEDAWRCPHCENYISAEDAPRVRKSWFIILGTILTLVLIYMLVMH
ncbi:MAG TPA: hypothetical protein VHX65_18510 [Pirellulales bacterium]|jgi:predicted nucleic acid-binding Zn ribbon protein|nr:hypothetical protein [Pirellulales bacterium]